MKKNLTLLFFLLACLKLSAYVTHTDILKLIVPVISSDTSKTNTPPAKDTIKLKDTSHYVDTGKLLAAINLKDSVRSNPSIRKDSVILAVATDSTGIFTAPAPQKEPTKVMPYVYNLGLGYTVKHKDSTNNQALLFKLDSLNLFALTRQADSLNVLEAVRFSDSLKQQVKLKSLDSLRWAQYKHTVDSVRRDLKGMTVDSLKGQLGFAKNDVFKGPIYAEIATRYLDYDTISNKRIRLSYQTEALSYTMKALHHYSYYNDTVGLRTCFDYLARVYMAQKKYSQAKWFILQSNTLSRAKRDVVNIIASLVTLSAIKSEQNDYTLAMRDLNEALQLSENNHYPKIELNVLKNFALLYSRLKNYDKEAIVLKKRDSLEDSIRKDEEARLMASLNLKDSTEKRKTDSVQTKKKVYTSNIKKLYKVSSAKKMASL
ncbi:hypothetical protein [Mucilaginibacter sp.]|uniref:hypothetical protein n=1 Tax=Mucilaginibacter sp. TaxID=1882438 RepID=UPI003D0B4286